MLPKYITLAAGIAILVPPTLASPLDAQLPGTQQAQQAQQAQQMQRMNEQVQRLNESVQRMTRIQERAQETPGS